MSWWLLSALLLQGGSYSISVSPRVLIAGQSIAVTCHVPALPESSQDTLEVGIEGYTTSVFEIHGTPWTKLMRIDHVPCHAGDAFCATVTDTDTHIARQPLFVGGCDDE